MRKYKSAADAARAMGIKAPTYQGHENGSRELTREAAKRYAAFFHINLHWLLTSIGDPGGRGEAQTIYDLLPPERKKIAISLLEALRES